MAKRKIVKINERKCTGCGLCIPNCVEGALQIVNGKAKLVKEIYCDGLGACLGHCPEGAITIEEREADGFNENAAKKHLEEMKKEEKENLPCGCPGTAVKTLKVRSPKSEARNPKKSESKLGNWPIQLMSVPTQAPYLKEADLLIAADCTAFSYPDFQPGRPVPVSFWRARVWAGFFRPAKRYISRLGWACIRGRCHCRSCANI